MKKIFVRCLVFALILSVFSAQGVFASRFPDVDSNEIYQTGIDFLAESGIIHGHPDGTFKPNDTLNRAEMMKIVAEGAAVYYGWDVGIFDVYANQSCFPDVSAGEWYTKYICYGKEQGWVRGYGDGTFQPGRTVSFVESLKITYAGFGLEFVEPEDEWFRDLVYRASSNNYIPHTVDSFHGNFVRNQMADMIARLIKDNQGELDDYLGDRKNQVVTYDTIALNKNVSEVSDDFVYNLLYNEDYNIHPLTSDVDILHILTSRHDPDRVFVVAQFTESGHGDGDEGLFEDGRLEYLGMSPDGDGVDPSYYYYTSSGHCEYWGGCSPELESKKGLIQDEAASIALSFSFYGEGESDVGCFYVSDHDFSFQFQRTWGNLDEIVFFDERHWEFSPRMFFGELVCSRIDGEALDDNGEVEEWESEYEKELAEIKATYDIEDCRAFDFPEFMIGRIAMIYRHCQDLYEQEEVASKMEFKEFEALIDGLIADGVSITISELASYLEELEDIWERVGAYYNWYEYDSIRIKIISELPLSRFEGREGFLVLEEEIDDLVREGASIPSSIYYAYFDLLWQYYVEDEIISQEDYYRVLDKLDSLEIV